MSHSELKKKNNVCVFANLVWFYKFTPQIYKPNNNQKETCNFCLILSEIIKLLIIFTQYCSCYKVNKIIYLLIFVLTVRRAQRPFKQETSQQINIGTCFCSLQSASMTKKSNFPPICLIQ